jgi:hypothetical protein
MKAPYGYFPKLKYQGARRWPPDWSGGYNGSLLYPHGEEGILRDVSVARRDLRGPERLELINQYEGRRFSGLLLLDDAVLVPKLRDTLSEHIGSPIKDVANWKSTSSSVTCDAGH